MLRLIGRRVLHSLGVLWAITTLVFVLSRVIGDPAALMLPLDSPPDQVEALRQKLGFADPILVQYGRFVGHALQGDLGTSAWTGQSVTSMVTTALPRTLILAIATFAVALVIGVGLAFWAVASRRRSVNRLIMLLSFASVSMPEFWFGLILITFVAVRFHLVPTSGYGGLNHLVLPVATLAIVPTGRIAQTARRAMLESMRQDYTLNALAKGMPRAKVLRRHGLRNSLLLIVTISFDELASLMAGQIVVEVIFAWPGIGYLSLQAINQRDPLLLVGIVIATSTLILTLNLIADILYAIIDPRVRAGVGVKEAVTT